MDRLSIPILVYMILVFFKLSPGQTLSDFVAPKITQQPDRENYALRKQPKTLLCRAEGRPTPNIVWYRDGAPVRSYKEHPSTSNRMTESGKLMFIALDRVDEGEYYCNASNRVGWSVSDKFIVRIAFLKHDFHNPQAKTASVGETVLMECRPPKGLPKPKVQWRKDTNMIEVDDRIKILDNGDLRIDRATRSDSGNYQCLAKNYAFSRESSVAPLRVRQKPRFLVTPSNKQVSVNGVATFHCQVIGDPKPIIVWRREADAKIPESRASLMDDRSLRIERVQLADAGNYVCQAGNEAGQVEAVAHLTVISRPGFLRTPEDQVVRVGSKVTFHCTTSGSPKPEMRWLHTDQTYLPIIGGFSPGSRRVVAYPGGQLIISSVRKADEGRYVCSATSYTGRMQSSAHLTVIGLLATSEPPLILLGPQNQTLRLGSLVAVTLPCLVAGSPVPSIKWYRNGVDMTRLNQDRRIIRLASGSLQINQLKQSDAGNYTCRAVSGQRSSQWTAFLNVLSLQDLRTEIRAPSDENLLPEPPYTVKVEDFGDTWVVLTLTGPKDKLTYQVEVYSLDKDMGWQIIRWAAIGNTIKVSGLRPETGYRFLVRGVNDYGVGRPRVLPRVVYTNAANANDDSNRGTALLDYQELHNRLNQVDFRDSIYLQSTATTEVKVSWAVYGSRMRYVTGFKLTYKPVPLSRCLAQNGKVSKPSSGHCSLSQELRDQLTLQFAGDVAVEGVERTKDIMATPRRYSTKTEVILDGLRPFVCYVVEVEPFADHPTYGRVRGRESKAQTVLTFDSTPSQAPQNIKAAWMSNTTISVRWNLPLLRNMNGVLTGFWVHVIENENKKIRTVKTKPSTRSLIIDNLIPEIGYTLHLAAGTCRGEGIRSPGLDLPPLHSLPISHQRRSLIDQPWFIATLASVIVCISLWLIGCFCLVSFCRRLQWRKTIGYTTGKLSVHPPPEQCLLQPMNNPQSTASSPPDLTKMLLHNNTRYDSPPHQPTTLVAPYATTSILHQMPADCAGGGSKSTSSSCGTSCSQRTSDRDGPSDWLMTSSAGGRQLLRLGEIIPPPPEYPPPPAPMMVDNGLEMDQGKSYLWTGGPPPSPSPATRTTVSSGYTSGQLQNGVSLPLHPQNTGYHQFSLQQQGVGHFDPSGPLVDVMFTPSSDHYVTGAAMPNNLRNCRNILPEHNMPYLHDGNLSQDTGTLESHDCHADSINVAHSDDDDEDDDEQDSFISSASESDMENQMDDSGDPARQLTETGAIFRSTNQRAPRHNNPPYVVPPGDSQGVRSYGPVRT